MNVRGALRHIIQTFVGSIHIIVTALVIHFTGFLLIDPLLGVAFGVVLLWASWGILCDACPSVGGRYTRRPRPFRDHGGVGSNRGIQTVHHVHVSAQSSRRYVFFGHLRVGDSIDPQTVLRISSDMLEDKFGFFFATLQVETECLDAAGAEAIDITRGAG